jgi:hypothetical protein
MTLACLQVDPIEIGASHRSYQQPVETPLSLERRTALR